MNDTTSTRCVPLLLAAVAAILLSLAPSDASAQSMYLGIGVGPAIHIDDWPNQVRIEEELGWYFGGRSGFFLGFAPSQSFGDDFWVLTFPLRLGGMFSVYRSRDFSFQLGPQGTVGFAASNVFNPPRGRDPDPWFHFSVAFLLRFLVADERVAFYLQPLGFEFAFGDSRFYGREAIRYVLVGGVQFCL